MTETIDQKLFVGIDIAAKTYTAAWGSQGQEIGAAQTYSQTQIGHQKLVKALKATGYSSEETLVVLEATGTYWMRVAVVLHRAGYRVSVINPRQAHHFAEALLRQA
jgi:transposase